MLTIKDGEFKMNGESLHYFRIMPEYWEDRLKKLKAAGFNTVETYVCWNMHEPKKGEFDFTGRFDIRRFIKTAQKVGLYAIVRPGPYICAEWDFGGLPAWLLKDRNMRLRCAYPDYLQHVSDFYRKAHARLRRKSHALHLRRRRQQYALRRHAPRPVQDAELRLAHSRYIQRP